MNSTDRLLIVVTDIIRITGRGIFPWPVVPHETIGGSTGEPLKIGDELELRRPDGSIVKTTLCGLEWPSPAKGGLILRLEASISEADLPLGTEIWKVGA